MGSKQELKDLEDKGVISWDEEDDVDFADGVAEGGQDQGIKQNQQQFLRNLDVNIASPHPQPGIKLDPLKSIDEPSDPDQIDRKAPVELPDIDDHITPRDVDYENRVELLKERKEREKLEIDKLKSKEKQSIQELTIIQQQYHLAQSKNMLKR